LTTDAAALATETPAAALAPRPPFITAAVLARDEGRYLADCLASLAWADELLVLVDDRTTDDTAVIARRYTPRVHVLPFESFPRFRNRGLTLARGEWVFFVDADERIPPALASEVRRAVAGAAENGRAGYWVARRNRIRGRWVRGAGWSPDYQLRLVHRGAARYATGGLVHEVATLDGSAGWLDKPLVHYNYDTLAEFIAKQRRYARLEAWTCWRRGERARARAYVGQPLREFWRRYVTLRGYRDGALGLVLSAYLAYAALLRTAALARLWRERGAALSSAGERLARA
jgi:glycosyltransferase involved in cell wall biosynthesis